MRILMMNCCFAGIICLGTFASLGAQNLKAPDAPFAHSNQVAIEMASEFSAAAITHGSKYLLWQNSYNNIQLLNKGQMVLAIRAQSRPSVPGWAPFTRFVNQVDPDKKTVTRTCKFNLTKDIGGEFRQTIRLCPDGRAEIAFLYDAGSNASLLKQQIWNLFLPLTMIRGTSVEVTENGTNVRKIALPDKPQWLNAGSKNWVNTGYFPKISKIVFFPDNPAQRFTLDFQGDIKHAVFFRSADGLEILFDFEKVGTPFTMTVNFGKSEAAHTSDCIVGGINFTQNNAYTVAVFPEKRNILMNPSFESGTRYYHNHNGGVAIPVHDGGARTGKSALVLKNNAVQTFNLPTPPNCTWTFSFYAKSLTQQNGTISCSGHSYRSEERRVGKECRS